jgi:hypothetical protein
LCVGLRETEDAIPARGPVGLAPLGGGFPASRHGKIARGDDEDYGHCRDRVE